MNNNHTKVNVLNGSILALKEAKASVYDALAVTPLGDAPSREVMDVFISIDEVIAELRELRDEALSKVGK